MPPQWVEQWTSASAAPNRILQICAPPFSVFSYYPCFIIIFVPRALTIIDIFFGTQKMTVWQCIPHCIVYTFFTVQKSKFHELRCRIHCQKYCHTVIFYKSIHAHTRWRRVSSHHYPCSFYLRLNLFRACCVRLCTYSTHCILQKLLLLITIRLKSIQITSGPGLQGVWVDE